MPQFCQPLLHVKGRRRLQTMQTMLHWNTLYVYISILVGIIFTVRFLSFYSKCKQLVQSNTRCSVESHSAFLYCVFFHFQNSQLHTQSWEVIWVKEPSRSGPCNFCILRKMCRHVRGPSWIGSFRSLCKYFMEPLEAWLVLLFSSTFSINGLDILHYNHWFSCQALLP